VINIIIVIVQKAVFKDVFLAFVLEILALLIVMVLGAVLVLKLGLSNFLTFGSNFSFRKGN
jgi:hypothetical protein